MGISNISVDFFIRSYLFNGSKSRQSDTVKRSDWFRSPAASWHLRRDWIIITPQWKAFEVYPKNKILRHQDSIHFYWKLIVSMQLDFWFLADILHGRLLNSEIWYAPQIRLFTQPDFKYIRTATTTKNHSNQEDPFSFRM